MLKFVGDGISTKVWIDKWIMAEHPRRPVNKQSMIDLDLVVSSLIDSDGHRKPNLLHDLSPDDVRRIKDIQIGALAAADRLRTRGLVVETTCKLYQTHVESINHVLFGCSVAFQLWDLVCIFHLLEANLNLVLDLMEGTTLTEYDQNLCSLDLMEHLEKS